MGCNKCHNNICTCINNSNYLIKLVADLQKRVQELEAIDQKGFIRSLDGRIADNTGDIKELDPTVPSWAKQPTKPTYLLSEIQGVPELLNQKVDKEAGKILIEDYLVTKVRKDFIEVDSIAEFRALSSFELSLLSSGIVKGVRVNGYYKKGDTPSSINYFISTTTTTDNSGSVIEVNGIKFEHKFINEINVRYFGLTGDESQNVVPILTKIIDYAIVNKLNISFPEGTYNSFISNMPFRNTEVNSGLRDFNNIVVYGVGRKTIFKSQSVTGADVFQINASKNLTIKNLSVTAEISSLTHSGSNGFSITNGFDNINIIDVHCYNLPSVPYSDPSLNYLDGGKAFTIQSSKGNSNYHGSINIKGTAENVGYGFGHDGFVDDIYSKNIVANIDVYVKRCYKGVAIAFAAPESIFSADDKSLNYNLKAKIEESQWDITMNRVFGGSYNFNILSTLDNTTLKINPLTNQPWLSSRPNTIAFNLAPVKNSNISIIGYKKECDQKGAIGSVGSISEPLYDGGTKNCDININLTGAFASEMTINTNAENRNVDNCFLNLSNFSQLPSVLYDSGKKISVILNGLQSNSNQTARQIFFKRQPTDAETLKLMISSSGILDVVGQRLGTIPDVLLFRLFGYNGTVDQPRFEFFNGGRLRITNSDNVSFNISSGLTLPEGNVDGISGDIYIRVGISGGVRIPASIYFKQTISGNTGWFRMDIPAASTTVKGTVNQSVASADTAAAPSATYTQAEVQAILTELRDLKTKLRTAGILQP